MTWKSAQHEAANRLAKLPIPADARLDGYTVTLIEFDADATAGLLVGGNSAEFQSMVNRALKKLLKKRGALVVFRRIKLSDTLGHPVCVQAVDS